jgi:hypothetical protein
MVFPDFLEVDDKKVCENCKWWDLIHDDGYGNCKDGIHKPDDDACIYWQSKIMNIAKQVVDENKGAWDKLAKE